MRRGVQRLEGQSGIIFVEGVQRILEIVLVEGIEGIVGVVLVDRIQRVAWIILIDRVQRILRIVGVDRIQRIIGTVLIERIEDVVVALIFLVEAHLGPGGSEGEQHRSQDEEGLHEAPPAVHERR